MKKWLALILAGILCFGGVLTVNAAELDPVWYANRYPDIVKQMGNSPEVLQHHYDTYGRREGRWANDHDTEALLRSLFNAAEYAELYPDVKEAYGNDIDKLFEHYITFGVMESRVPSKSVPYKLAQNMQKEIKNEMTKVGLAVEPGSPLVVAVLTGDNAGIEDYNYLIGLSRAQRPIFNAINKAVYNVEHPIYDTRINGYRVRASI